MGAWTTRDLLKAKREGAVIRVWKADEEHADRQVTYDPEKPGDRTPWRLVRGEARFSAAECRPTSLHGGPWVLARLLRINVP